MKLTTSLALLFIGATAFAQPVINSSAAPQAGSTWTDISAEEPENISLGNAGANQTWDFSGVTADFDSDVLSFISQSALPASFDGMFPGADVVLYTPEDTTAQFFIVETDGLYTDGIGSPVEGTEPPNDRVDFDPNDLLIPFGFSYNDVREHESSYVFEVDFGVPFQFRSNTYTTFTGDGYGTVITPAGTFSNVLRTEISTYSIDSVFTDTNMDGEFEFMSTDGPTETSYTYFFLQNQAPLLVASLDLTEDQSGISYFSYIQEGSVGLTENQLAASIQLYPNPSTGRFNVKSDLSGDAELQVMDLNGRLVHSQKYRTTDLAKSIDLQHLGAGTYMVTLRTAKGVSSNKVTIE